MNTTNPDNAARRAMNLTALGILIPRLRRKGVDQPANSAHAMIDKRKNASAVSILAWKGRRETA
jgi:hypothetical protein